MGYLLWIGLACLITLLYLRFAPQRKLRKYQRYLQSLGYKVKVVKAPYHFMSFYFSTKRNLKSKNDALALFKHEAVGCDVYLAYGFSGMLVFLISKQLIKNFFSMSESLPKRKMIYGVLTSITHGRPGLVFAEGNEWKRKRRILSSVFTFDFINSLSNDIVQQTNKRIESLIEQNLKQKDEITIDMRKDILVPILSQVITTCFFGSSLPAYKYKDQPFHIFFVEYIEEVMSTVRSLPCLLFGSWIMSLGLTQSHRRINSNTLFINAFCKEFLEARIDSIRKGQSNDKKDIVSVLYGSMKQKQVVQLQKTQLLEQFITFYIAGTDTTSNLVMVVLYYLSMHPSVLTKARKQIRTIHPTYNSESLAKLQYINAILNQSLRMNGPGNLLMPRAAQSKIILGNMIIPKGAAIIPCSTPIHYNDKFYQNPYEFNPQRWIDHKNDPFSFISFSGGSRNCIGQNLARIQAKVLLCKLILQYDIEPIEPFVMDVNFVYGPKYSKCRMKKIIEQQ